MIQSNDTALVVVIFGDGSRYSTAVSKVGRGWFPRELREVGRAVSALDPTNRFGGIAGAVVVDHKDTYQYNANEALEVMELRS